MFSEYLGDQYFIERPKLITHITYMGWDKAVHFVFASNGSTPYRYDRCYLPLSRKIGSLSVPDGLRTFYTMPRVLLNPSEVPFTVETLDGCRKETRLEYGTHFSRKQNYHASSHFTDLSFLLFFSIKVYSLFN